MFEQAPGIPMLENMKGKEDKGYDKEKSKYKIVEEIL